jgi:hypothetical protein
MKRMGIMILAIGLCLFAQVAQADWTTAKRLTWTSGQSAAPVVAVDFSGNLHIVWYDDTPGNYEIYYKKSADGGVTWTSVQRLTWTSGQSAYPAIAVAFSSMLHVVWGDNTPGNTEIYYKRSTDGGTTWTSAQRLTWTSSSGYQAIAVDSSGNLHMVWESWVSAGGGRNEIYYKRSTDGGTTWTSAQRLTWTSSSIYPAIAIDSSGNLHVVWMDNTPGNYEIYYKKSADGGATWTSAQRLTWTLGDSWYPAIAVDSSGNLHVVYRGNTPGNYEIYYKKSADGGATWTSAQRLTWTSGNSWHPAIAVDSSGNLHVVWDDYTPGNYEIYYKKGTNGGATWTSAQRLTVSSGSSIIPDIAVDSSGNLHIVWYDDTPGNLEIYYKKGK